MAQSARKYKNLIIYIIKTKFSFFMVMPRPTELIIKGTAPHRIDRSRINKWNFDFEAAVRVKAAAKTVVQVLKMTFSSHSLSEFCSFEYTDAPPPIQ
ncbi:MAG: hypothetical protein J0L82_04985 [Deltaproteobacteria bacterium]|nr:hypothetical protein [Deltaproteobacteria bacterium]